MMYIIKNLKRHKYVITTAIVLLCLLIYYLIDPVEYLLMPKCPVKMITTLDCPGCGFQRALHASLHGRFSEAIHYNLFLVLAIPVAILWWVINTITYRPVRHSIQIKLVRINKIIVYFYLFSYFIWFVIRNIN